MIHIICEYYSYLFRRSILQWIYIQNECYIYPCVWWFYIWVVCPGDRFGAGCTRECHCQEGDVCDYIDGTCSTDDECAKGWGGAPYCQNSK